ncbi:MAG: Tol-Pal system beta propeller repeat protein TolB [Steroidobacteraceae bacterium]
MTDTRLALIIIAMALLPARAWAQLQVEITSGVTDPIPIAIVPFASGGVARLGNEIAGIVDEDLARSGRFRTMERGDMLSRPSRKEEVVLEDWRMQRNDYVVVGRLTARDGEAFGVTAELVNVLNGQRLFIEQFDALPATLRAAAHRISDLVFEKTLGIRGAFSTRIAYVSVDGSAPKQRYQLVVADADGASPRIVLESRLPIMSPAFSADGAWLAYVSFESRASAIYVQRLATGERRRVSARAGINGAPAWSPDGRKLAVTLGGRNGNLDIYMLDLQSQELTRLTDDPAIDTEPAFSSDGKSLYFTSDRAGGPQVYRMPLAGNARPQRVTFTASYNARPRPSPDGQKLAMVTLDGNAYRIAIQDLASGQVTVLSNGGQDESPSFAPNGVALIYAGKRGGRPGLLTVSSDGAVQQQLAADRGEVREPVWGPFVN